MQKRSCQKIDQTVSNSYAICPKVDETIGPRLTLATLPQILLSHLYIKSIEGNGFTWPQGTAWPKQ